MDHDNQCCAIENNIRCVNNVIGHSNHCTDHIGPAKILYKKYKKICDVAYNLDLNKNVSNIEEHVKYIIECYEMFNKAYDARMAHRKYAFVPECYDYGHDYQFIFIKNKILECEKILSELQMQYHRALMYETNNYTILNNEDVNIKEEDIFNIDIIPKTIMESNKRRNDTEQDVNEIMDKYIKENQEILKKKEILNRLFIECIDNIVYKYIDKKYLSYYQTELQKLLIRVSIFHVICKLYRMEYFTDEFEPEKCQCNTCDNYLPYKFKITCRCVYNYGSFENYINHTTEKLVKGVYNGLLLHSKKYIPIFNDMFLLFIIFDAEMLFMRIELRWDPKLNRLKMNQCIEEKEEKKSKYLARFRLKNKYLQKYIDTMPDDDSGDSD
jgi:hypothetical protein